MPSYRPIVVLLFAAVPAALAAQAAPKTVRLTAPTASVNKSFDAISGIRELPSGRVLVSDGIAEQVSVVDLGKGSMTPDRAEGPRAWRVPAARPAVRLAR